MLFLFRGAMAASACLLALQPAVSAASALRVDPIELELSEARRVATVTLRNEDSHPVTVRAYALAWTQQGGEDVYDEDRSLILSPPVFTVPSGGEQLMRVGARGSVEGRAFRVMIEEVPIRVSPEVCRSPCGSTSRSSRISTRARPAISPGRRRAMRPANGSSKLPTAAAAGSGSMPI